MYSNRWSGGLSVAENGGTTNGNGRFVALEHDLASCKDRCALVQQGCAMRMEHQEKNCAAKSASVEAALMTVNEAVMKTNQRIDKVIERQDKSDNEKNVERAKQDASVKIFVALTGVFTTVVVAVITLFVK